MPETYFVFVSSLWTLACRPLGLTLLLVLAYLPRPNSKPGIRAVLQNTPKTVVSRCYQLLSGHALRALFLKEKWKWTDSDTCRWCGKGRQTREHLFKKCKQRRREIRTLWEKVGELSGEKGLEVEVFQISLKVGKATDIT